MIEIKLKNKVNIKKNYGESQTYIVTAIETRGTENVHGITLMSCSIPLDNIELDVIENIELGVIEIDFNPYEFSKKYLNKE